jgi:ribosomal protein S18 acetylase RimI-like enzyme
MLANVVEVRRVGPDDWLIWRSLRLAALAESPLAFAAKLADWQGDGDREHRWRSRLSLPRSSNVIAMLDGQPVGMASGVLRGHHVVELISMWVAPKARRGGVGGALIRDVESWARSIGARTVRLQVAADNQPARALYQRNGYADTAEPGELLADGVSRAGVMAKEL